MLLLNVIVLIMEVLYYSLFMKFAKGDGKFWRYLLLFVLINIIFIVVDTLNISYYIILLFMILYGMKYIVKVKVSVYDILFIILMLIFKLIMETPLSLFAYIFIKNVYIVSIITGIIKVAILLLINNKINILYNKIHKLWINNNFYIRYIFTIFMFIYIIASCLFFIIKWI